MLDKKEVDWNFTRDPECWWRRSPWKILCRTLKQGQELANKTLDFYFQPNPYSDAIEEIFLTAIYSTAGKEKKAARKKLNELFESPLDFRLLVVKVGTDLLSMGIPLDPLLQGKSQALLPLISYDKDLSSLSQEIGKEIRPFWVVAMLGKTGDEGAKVLLEKWLQAIEGDKLKHHYPFSFLTPCEIQILRETMILALAELKIKEVVKLLDSQNYSQKVGLWAEEYLPKAAKKFQMANQYI